MRAGGLQKGSLVLINLVGPMSRGKIHSMNYRLSPAARHNLEVAGSTVMICLALVLAISGVLWFVLIGALGCAGVVSAFNAHSRRKQDRITSGPDLA
jgi:hypothetical protein